MSIAFITERAITVSVTATRHSDAGPLFDVTSTEFVDAAGEVIATWIRDEDDAEPGHAHFVPLTDESASRQLGPCHALTLQEVRAELAAWDYVLQGEFPPAEAVATAEN